MKLFSYAVSIALIGLVAVGCGQPDGSSTPSETTATAPLTLAVIPKSTGGEFWETVEKGAKKASADLGTEIKWEGTVTETEIAEQNKIRFDRDGNDLFGDQIETVI